MHCPSHIPWFNDPNSTGFTIQTARFFIVLFFALLLFFITGSNSFFNILFSNTSYHFTILYMYNKFL